MAATHLRLRKTGFRVDSLIHMSGLDKEKTAPSLAAGLARVSPRHAIGWFRIGGGKVGSPRQMSGASFPEGPCAQSMRLDSLMAPCCGIKAAGVDSL